MSGVVSSRKRVAALVSSQRLAIVPRHDRGRRITVRSSAVHVNLGTSQVLLDGCELPRPAPAAYFVFQKPVGCITTRGTDQSKRHTRPSVMDVLRCDERNAPLLEADAKPVGRLDCDSEGLLFFSNDGDFTKAVLRPEFRVPKTYLVVVSGRRLPKFIDRIAEADLLRLRQGVRLGNSKDIGKAEEADIVKTHEVLKFKDWGWNAGKEECLSMTLCEGKFREVRRMIKEIGLRVVRLRRVAIGGVEDPLLPFGLCRQLSEEEQRGLLQTIGGRLSHDEIRSMHWR
ncbi:unnamed protein product [Chondrus crispus]|uniref:Pseudouridine synthase RsuA/RluA-like domain-containing protein n=1 Tax=Chondrus crispus TaxID=2769 RepID=R7QKV7_CHOCR|nr:unnamed protein product [Chondrus crispus]CDF38005.1 unnamed protein product [Chondrus crispus]|eukprot:XP_005717874.1 unnamed protein product [Chondrus crispus]